jgi:hypothetical protein
MHYGKQVIMLSIDFWTQIMMWAIQYKSPQAGHASQQLMKPYSYYVQGANQRKKMGWTTLVDQDGNEIGMVGDTPWDIMAAAIENINRAYQRNYDRNATEIELQAILDFVMPHEV